MLRGLAWATVSVLRLSGRGAMVGTRSTHCFHMNLTASTARREVSLLLCRIPAYGILAKCSPLDCRVVPGVTLVGNKRDIAGSCHVFPGPGTNDDYAYGQGLLLCGRHSDLVLPRASPFRLIIWAAFLSLSTLVPVTNGIPGLVFIHRVPLFLR